MKATTIFCIFLALTVKTPAQQNYPLTKTVDSSDIDWGVKLPDPYRWLEDLNNQEVQTWFKLQADYTNTLLAKIPGQDKLLQELKDLNKLSTAVYTPVAKAGGKYFYRKQLPGEQAAKFYYRQGPQGEERLLFDPQRYIAGQTMNYSPVVSVDGTRVILNLSKAGAEIADVHVLDVTTAAFLPDTIPHTWGGAFAGPNNTDILYTQTPNYDVHDTSFKRNNPTKLHVIGTPLSTDITIASSQKNPEIVSPVAFPDVFVYTDCPFIFLSIGSADRNLTLYYAPKSALKSEHVSWKPLTKTADQIKRFFPHGHDIYFLTSKGNPKFQITKVDLNAPNLARWTTIARGEGDWKISDVLFVQTKDYLVFNKAKNELVIQPYAYEFTTGKLTKIDVPLQGNVYGAAGLSTSNTVFSKEDDEILIINSGWSTPLNFYSYNVKTRTFQEGIFHTNYSYPSLGNIASKEIEVPSYDGTMVPLSLVYDKTKLKKDGSNICFLYGYGAYGSILSPVFNASHLLLLSRGVIIATAHVRGGGEKGDDWHLDGMKSTKHNTWKDFNACAEYLIQQKYSSPAKMSAGALSAGGILLGRAITERPDLYKAIIVRVGWLNATRTEFSPNGAGNIPEFGTVKDSLQFRALLEMDAYQHIGKGVRYPAQLITTGWNDQRVSSYFPAKFAAKMQAQSGTENPVLLYVDYGAGHFGASTKESQFAQTVKEDAFLLWQCGDPDFQVR